MSCIQVDGYGRFGNSEFFENVTDYHWAGSNMLEGLVLHHHRCENQKSRVFFYTD